MSHHFVPRSVRYAVVSAVLGGDNTVIAAPGANKAILVLNYSLRVVGASGGTTIEGLDNGDTLPLPAASAPGNLFEAHGNSGEVGVLKGETNTALVFDNDTGVTVNGHIVYRIVQDTI